MAHRHKVHARGGRAGKETHEAHEHEVEHEAGLKRGGHAHHKGGGKVHGGKHKHRYARGGRAGADKHPFSSAHRG